ncbi:MAG: patatin-like phospholipase family protein [Phycisphaerales bacterium]|nr:patatin-like phospholipase family protein [Phycisphaerales bacterium]MCB9858770.1 patatin-like phospholipase family protein [Phycisphaerales bacterium]
MFFAANLILLVGLQAAQTPAAEANRSDSVFTRPYRIGIVAYDNITGRASKMAQQFAQIGHTVVFASGTAEEVLDWVDAGLVDIAVLSPGALAATSAVLNEKERISRRADGTYPTWDCRYLITPELPPSISPFASPKRRGEGCYTYAPLCLIHRESLAKLQNEYKTTSKSLVDIIVRASRDGRLQFVFGDPMSLSGTIVPRAQLDSLNVDWFDYSELSFGHNDTLQLLLDSPEVIIANTVRHRVGFVFDGSVPSRPIPHKDSHLTNWFETRLQRMQSDLIVINLPPPPEPNELGGQGGVAPQPQIEESERQDPLGVTALPAEVWVVRADFEPEDISTLRAKLLTIRSPDGARRVFRHQHDCEQGNKETAIQQLAKRIQFWARSTRVSFGGNGKTRYISLREILDSMRHYYRRYGDRPRLALVLSGGGAKCAYQAGAIASIEEQIRAINDQASQPHGLPSPDIDLVVGTSGGALNALPTAIGVTAADNANASRLCDVWRSIDLVNLLDPYLAARILLGILIGMILIQATWFIDIIRDGIDRRLTKLTMSPPETRKKVVRAINLAYPVIRLARSGSLVRTRILLLLLIVAFMLTNTCCPSLIRDITPTSRLTYYLFWLPFRLSTVWIVIVLLVNSAWLVSHGYNRASSTMRFASIEVRVWRRGALFLTTLGLFCVFSAFFHKSLSQGDLMREQVVGHFQQILDGEIRQNRSNLGGLDQQETALSTAICDSTLNRRRDFVMTVSILGSSGTSDKYVYLPAQSSDSQPEYLQRAINIRRGSELSFVEDPTQIIRLVIASGTIFPVFPARPFIDPSGRSTDLYIVDGGFAHNIPIEAAVDWGATHIIAIEASPVADLRERGSFLQNIGVAFDHLFAQAQLTDMRSRQRVEIYVLRPSQEILKTLDFIPEHLDRAINVGYDDATKGRFHQNSRAPVFEIFETRDM